MMQKRRDRILQNPTRNKVRKIMLINGGTTINKRHLMGKVERLETHLDINRKYIKSMQKFTLAFHNKQNEELAFYFVSLNANVYTTLFYIFKFTQYGHMNLPHWKIINDVKLSSCLFVQPCSKDNKKCKANIFPLTLSKSIKVTLTTTLEERHRNICFYITFNN